MAGIALLTELATMNVVTAVAVDTGTTRGNHRIHDRVPVTGGTRQPVVRAGQRKISLRSVIEAP